MIQEIWAGGATDGVWVLVKVGHQPTWEFSQQGSWGIHIDFDLAHCSLTAPRAQRAVRHNGMCGAGTGAQGRKGCLNLPVT